MSVRTEEPIIDSPALSDLFQRCRSVNGFEPLSEHKLSSWARGSGRGLVYEDGDNLVGYLHVVESKRPGTFEFEMAIDPSYRGRVEAPLILTAIDDLRRIGAEDVLGWAYGPGVAEILLGLGFTPMRTLHQMRIALPLDDPALPGGIEVRGFREGDDAALLAVINRAFVGHLEAGNWDRDDLDERRAHPWYDAAGIRMAWQRGRLVAFCWTKMHSRGVGEIYLIATDPSEQGNRRGRMMVLEGLRYLFEERDARTGMLYADGDNEPALRMYRGLGFTVHHTDRAYRYVL